MTAAISPMHDENTNINPCCCYDEDENNSGRKRRRPQQEFFLNDSSLFFSNDGDSPTQQKTQMRKTPKNNRRSSTRKGIPTIVLLITLLFTCYQQDQHSYPISYAHATKLRESANQNTNLRQRRFLQNEANAATSDSDHVAIDYLEVPRMLWMRKDSEDQYLKGNAIQVSPFDDSILYATSHAGDLRILSAVNGDPIDRLSPSPRTITEEKTTSTWSLYSDSGMAFGTFPGAQAVPPEIDTETNDDNSYNEYLQFLLNNGIEHTELEESEQQQLHFVVYSIVDEAPSESRFLPKTRVVCVSIPEHKILWTSAGLPGKPNGSPLIYYAVDVGLPPLSLDSASQNDDENGKSEDDDANGMYIALTHNSVLIRPDNTTRTTGHLTILDPLSGHVKWTQSEWSRDEIPKGYGPPQVAHSPVLGGELSGGSLDNKNDIVIWTSSDQQGGGRVGNLYSFQMKSPSDLELEMQNTSIPEEKEEQSEQYDPFQVRVLKRVRWNSIARPTLNRNGTNLYIGVTGNAVRGWSGAAKFNATADWSTRLVPFNSGNSASSQTYSEDVVVSTTPVLSADEERLFVVSARNETICLNSRDGSRMWSATTPESSPLLGEPKASPDNQRLYMIMSRDGTVNGVDQKSGKVLWIFGCDKQHLTHGTKCENPPVSGDFDLSSDGHILYFGTADGRVVAITLGHRIDVDEKDEEEEPQLPISTGTSTISIGYDDDDKGPLEFDENSVGTFDNVLNNDQNVSGGKIAGSLFAIFLSLAISALSVMYVMKVKGMNPVNWANYRFPRHRSSPDGGGERNSFVTVVSRGIFRVEGGNQESDGPDKYEDQIIATHSDNEKCIEQQFNTLWVDPTHSNPKAITNGDESPTADRLAVMLGTSNRIAPISESFGYGQAVLL